MLQGTASSSLPDVEILQGICHAFGSATDLGEVMETTPVWVERAVAPGFVSARVLPLWIVDDEPRQIDAVRTAEAKTPNLIDHRGRGEGVVRALFPLVSRGESMGALEVVARREAIEERWEIIEAISSQAAIVLRNLRQRDHLEREARLLKGSSRLATNLMRAKDPEDAVRRALARHYEMTRIPTAGWLRGEDSSWIFIAGHGVTSRARRALRSDPPPFARWSVLNSRQKARVRTRLAETIGVPAVSIAHSGDAIIAVAADATEPYTLSVVRLLREVLKHLRTSARAEELDRDLDKGIAWTAHEFRTSLLGARAALERVNASQRSDPDRGLLSRTHEELGRLSRLVESLLPWVLGRSALQATRLDLADTARAALRSCGVEEVDRRVSIQAPTEAPVEGEGPLLKVALSNLLRNALVYSPPDSPVAMSIGRQDGHVVVSIADRGPGVLPEESTEIFQPFVRGRAGKQRPSGTGMGLYIARRVVEAHRGSIWVEDHAGGGAVFRFSLPVARGMRSGTPEVRTGE